MRKSCLHVGFSKAATTFLQSRFFSQHDEIFYLGQPATIEDVVQFMIEIRCRDSLQYQEDRSCGFFERSIEPLLGDERKIVAISNEGFTVINAADRGIISERLYKFFPEAKIVFTIRNQMNLLESLYFELHKNSLRRNERVNTFGNWLTKDMYLDHSSSQVYSQKYYDIVSLYKVLYGKKNILILPVERIGKDVKSTFDDLCEFLEIHPMTFDAGDRTARANKRISAREVAYRTFRSYFFPNIELDFRRFSPRLKNPVDFFIRGGPPAAVDWPEGYYETVAEIYRAGNRKLAEEFDLPLNTLGYPM